MSSTEDLRVSFRADVPKENLQVLDTVLNELFGTFSSKMKQASEFIEQTMEQTKMRPPQLNTEEDTSEPKEESETDEEMPDLISDSASESDSQEEDVQECDSESEAECDESEDEHVFVLLVDGATVGYSPTLRGARNALQEYRDQVLADFHGPFRVEQNPNSFRIYRKTPYLWFMYSEHLVVEAEIEVITKL